MIRVELELKSDHPIENASTAQVLSAFHRVGGRVEESLFMIVFDTVADSFLQLLREDDDSYHMEIQLGSPNEHFQHLGSLTFGEAALTLISYAEQSFNFDPQCWEKMEIK